MLFRASTREQALVLDLRGHARNLDDGSVEVVAAGDDAAIDRLETWLHRGPPLARVERVACSSVDGDGVSAGFLIR